MSQVTVGGREVLGGNEKLLNKNLPSDAVSKIQLNTKFKSNPFASSLQEAQVQRDISGCCPCSDGLDRLFVPVFVVY